MLPCSVRRSTVLLTAAFDTRVAVASIAAIIVAGTIALRAVDVPAGAQVAWPPPKTSAYGAVRQADNGPACCVCAASMLRQPVRPE